MPGIKNTSAGGRVRLQADYCLHLKFQETRVTPACQDHMSDPHAYLGVHAYTTVVQ